MSEHLEATSPTSEEETPTVISTTAFDAMYLALRQIVAYKTPVTDLGWATIGEKAVELAKSALKIVEEDQDYEDD